MQARSVTNTAENIGVGNPKNPLANTKHGTRGSFSIFGAPGTHAKGKVVVFENRKIPAESALDPLPSVMPLNTPEPERLANDLSGWGNRGAVNARWILAWFKGVSFSLPLL